MGVVKHEEIVGYWADPEIGGESLICPECADGDDLEDLTQDQLLLSREVERGADNQYFCDRCGKEITLI